MSAASLICCKIKKVAGYSLHLELHTINGNKVAYMNNNQNDRKGLQHSAITK